MAQQDELAANNHGNAQSFWTNLALSINSPQTLQSSQLLQLPHIDVVEQEEPNLDANGMDPAQFNEDTNRPNAE